MFLRFKILESNFPDFEVAYMVVPVRQPEVDVQAVALLLPDVAFELLVLIRRQETQVLFAQQLDAFGVRLLEEEAAREICSNAKWDLTYILG